MNQIRDCLSETAAAKATTSGTYYAGAGLNALAERSVVSDYIATAETETSGSFVDLATPGPTVTVTTGAAALVFWSCKMASNTVGGASEMGMQVTGPSTSYGPTFNQSIQFMSATANQYVDCSYAMPFALTAGSNTFTAKYRQGGGTSTYTYRRVIVMPF